MQNTATAINSKHIGDDFEQSFICALTAAGTYVQQMPSRVGFDFLIGGDSKPRPVELKCVLDGRLRLKHFTQIEINTAEVMTAAGIDYYVAYPLLSGFGVTTWARIRRQLLARETVVLNQANAVMWLPDEQRMREAQ